MILAAGLTPAWQQILVLPRLQVGEVNRATQAVWCASGKVLNVAVAIHHLGAPVQTLSFVGGHTGDRIQAEFEQLGIPARWIPTASTTRICTTLLDQVTWTTTELVENSPAVTAEELQAFATAFAEEARRADLIVLSGSLPVDVPSDFYRRLLESTDRPVLLDVRGAELLSCLPLRPWLVKPNREELAATAGRALSSDADLHAAMTNLRERGAQNVVVSDGARTLWSVTAEGVQSAAAFAVETVNPIGCGDCLAAGLAVAHHKGRPWPETLRFGLASAAENARTLLPARLDRERVDALATQEPPRVAADSDHKR